MQTTCPECRTTFRVSQDHLGARRGLVRCGHCNAVFNAYDTLLPELEEAPAETLPEHQDQHAELVAVEACSQPETPDIVETPAEAQVERSLPDALAEAESVTLAETKMVIPVFALEDESREIKRDILLEPLWPEPTQRAWTWSYVFSVVVAMLLVVLLALQSAYFFRAELAAAAPPMRPLLEYLCRPLHCVVPLPRQLTQEAISASSLEHDVEQRSRVRLTFLLTNRTRQTQAWPQITLILSDVREAPVAQQVFRPQAYLPKDVKPAAGMAPGSEREIRLELDFGNLVASGYMLRLGYP